MIHTRALVLGIERLSPLFYLVELKSPIVASQAKPGQFVHLRVAENYDPLLRRPFSLHNTKPSQGTFYILFKLRGKGTQALSQSSAGEELDLIGPLGNGFPPPSPDQLPILVAGGAGIAPLFMLAQRLSSVRKGLFFWGARGREEIFLQEEISSWGWELRVSTEDGSLGHRGMVTDLLGAYLSKTKDDQIIYACGPWGMLKEVNKLSKERDLPCWVSLEENMACGIGACWGCAVRCRVDEGLVYRRICKDGPVFPAQEVVWESR